MRAFSWVADCQLLTVSSCGGSAPGSSLASFLRARIPFKRALSPQPNHQPPKSPPPNSIPLGVRFQHMNGGAVQTTAICFYPHTPLQEHPIQAGHFPSSTIFTRWMIFCLISQGASQVPISPAHPKRPQALRRKLSPHRIVPVQRWQQISTLGSSAPPKSKPLTSPH